MSSVVATTTSTLYLAPTKTGSTEQNAHDKCLHFSYNSLTLDDLVSLTTPRDRPSLWPRLSTGRCPATMESDDDVQDVITIAKFRILPYTSVKHHPATPRATVAATERLMKWVHHHNFPKPLPEQSPSPAAIALFNLLATRNHRLIFDVRPAPPAISVTLRAVIPNSMPFQLHPGDVSLRLILWHITRFAQNTSLPLASCGFACDSSCSPATDKRGFHLSRVFQPTTIQPSPRKRPRRPNCRFLNLPDDVLLRVIFLLDPEDYTVLSATHPYLHDFLLPIVPGLKLRLFPHQLQALSRMSQMETPRLQSFPLLEPLPTHELDFGHILADLVSGSILLLEEIPQVKLPVGGLFCDEPGLGKTITALSLVLRTRGQVPKAPTGCATQPFTASNGREVFAYKDKHINRFSSYGTTTADLPSRKQRLLPGVISPSKRTSTRRVRIPEFYSATKGLGSVPVVEESRHIFLSGATLIAVPPVLVPHWQSQIEQHVHAEMIQVLYIRSRADLPEDALELASYDVVLVSFELLIEMYRDLRFGAPVLLQVHFYRVIVDEGHRLSSSSVTKLISVCDRLRADVRWVMTGTPTPATPRSDIDTLHNLLKFIQDEAYGLDRDAWYIGVRSPFESYKKESLDRLAKLMDQIMIRADKSILKAKCHVKNVFLHFSRETADSYNGLVRMARRNLITTDWFDPKHKESLLNPNKLTDARAVMANLRKACCFGGTMDVNFNTGDIAETLDELYEKYREKAGIGENDRFKDPVMEMHLLDRSFWGAEMDDPEDERRREDIQRRADLYYSLNPPPLRLSKEVRQGPHIVRSLRMAYSGKLQQIGNALLNCECLCARCGTQTKYPLVTPCGHLICDECVTRNKFACPVRTCGVQYTMDDKKVPEDLIELQPSIQSHQWRDDWAETTSSKISYLIKRIESLPRNEVWRPNDTSPRMIPPKVIVHSEYGDHLKLVAMQMKKSEKLSSAYVEMIINTRDIEQDRKNIKASQYAARSVQRFAEEAEAQVLLMNSRHGAVGLDLSFVQYIFLLEPLWDSANELQVVSRAHRIGCKGDIFVERLVMKNSVEQDMLADLQSSVNRLEESGLLEAKAKAEIAHRKVTNLLRNLKVVRHDSIVRDSERETTASHGIQVVDHMDWTENEEIEHSSESGPGSSEMDSSESRPPSLAGMPTQGGILKRRRSEREPSAEPRRVRFRE